MRVKDIVFLAVAAALGVLWLVVVARVWPAVAPAAGRTPGPTPLATTVEVPRLPGTIAFAQRGDILIVRDGRMTLLASGGRREPALSRDGTRIAYTVAGTIDGKRIVEGQLVPAHLAYESIVARALSAGAEKEAGRPGGALPPAGSSGEQVLVDGLQRRDPGGAHEVEFELQPAWSPDGAQLAFISDGGAGADLQILVLAQRRLLTLSSGSVLADPAWSPDGKTIAATTYTAGEPALLLVPVDGRTQAQRFEIPREGQAYRPSYSPDGRWLLVTLRSKRGNDLVAVELVAGRAPTIGRIVELTQGGRSWGGVFSADGAHVAFLRDHEGSIDVFVMELGGRLQGGEAGKTFRLSQGGVDGTSRPSWSR